MAPPDRPSLAELAARRGAPVACAGNLPVDLDDPDFFWFVDEGAVDLFLVEKRDGVQQSAPQHLLRAAAGRLLPGVVPHDGETTLSLIAKGLPGTTIRRLPIADLGTARPDELATQVDAWLSDVSAMLVRDVMNRPRPDALVEPGQDLPADLRTLSARRGVVWVSGLTAGAGLYLDLIDPVEHGPDDGPGTIPLTPASWITMLEAAPSAARASKTLAEEGLLLPALLSFHAVAFALERLNRRLAAVDQANLERARSTSRRSDEEGARRRLFNLYGLSKERGADAADSALPDALRIIGHREGISFKFPARSGRSEAAVGLDAILDASGVRARRVRLRREDKWWLGDANPMLAFREEDGRPVALVPGLFGRYREIDPSDRSSARVTAKRAGGLRADAWMFYRPLPPSSAGPADLFRIAGKGLTADLVRLVLAGLPGGLIALLPALVLGLVVDDIVPGGDTGMLYAATAGLAALALIGVMLHVLQGMALMRLEGRTTSRLEAAFWDRLLRLPPGMLHRYPAGDLAMRGMTFQNLRNAVQGVVANAILSIFFLLPAFAIIFYYDTMLGGVAVAFSLLSLLLTAILGLRQVSPHGRAIGAVRRVAGRLFQIVNGISKLRVDCAEGSAFAVWARDYREQKRAELELGNLEEHLQAFCAALPFLAGAALLFAAALPGRAAIGVGDFLVVYTVFMVFQTAVARLGDSFGAVAAALPAFEQFRPFLAEAPEASADGEAVENLGGDILFDHVSFRYDPDGPLILDDITIHARPGEFIAIAGESGAGKSTLFRLALGLDQPSGGAVYFDGRDLRHLNVKQVRRRIGVVPQAVQLHPQDLWDNIVAHHEGVTSEEAWQAAGIAGVDDEIKAMPMGMLTPVGASAAVMSGGESQRIMIARALIRSPRILLLDEATNWLDNESQSKVMDNLAALTSTRIVIAHRLSTLQQADRIFVMQAGKVVQRGTFRDLMETEGVFRDLVRRQVA